MDVATERRSTSGALGHHLPELMRLAYLFSGDRNRAGRLAGVALGRALARPFSARDTERTEARALAALARRAPRKTRTEPTDEAAWRAYLGLSKRRRVALALSVAKEMDSLAISEVLGCSPNGADALLERAWGEVKRSEDAGETEFAIRLREVFDAKLSGLNAETPVPPSARAWRWRAAVLIVVAFGAGFASITLPRLLDEGRNPVDRAERPRFDAPQPGRLRLPIAPPRVSPKVAVAEGSVTGVAAWTLQAYRAENDLICFELRAGGTFGDRHCIDADMNQAHAFASPDPEHGLTFVYGNVGENVERVDLVEKGASDRPFDVVDVPAGLRIGDVNLFAGLIAGYLVPLTSEDLESFRDYELANMSLLGRTADGDPVVSYELLLGRPRP